MDCFMPGFPSFNISQSLLKLMSIESVMDIYPSNYLTLCHPPLAQSFPSSGSFPISWLFTSGGPSAGASASMNIDQWIFRTYFLWDNLVWSPNCPRDSQKTSPAPSNESSCSLALNLLYGPGLTSVHNYWKNHVFDYTDLWWQRNISAF